jgi:hypothetical protein
MSAFMWPLDEVPTVPEMTEYTMRYLLKKYGFKAKEISPYRDTIRFDIIGINRNKREIRIIEVKSCRRDFVSDKKWDKYLPYCTHFAFAAPKGVISVAELPQGVGLIEFWYEDYGLHGEYTRKCGRFREKLDDDKYVSLLEAILMRQMIVIREFREYFEVIEQLESLNDKVALILKKASDPP